MYAKPSKEWVIPPRPRPGRKLKKDSAAVAAEEDEDEAKKVQNRVAQRAFRERKQSQFAELQARIEQYERGEIERNVALQAAAKRLKEDNDALKKENAELRQSLETFNCPSCSSERNHLKRSAGDEVDGARSENRRGRPARVNPSKRMRPARTSSTVSSVASSFVTSEASSGLLPPTFSSASRSSTTAVANLQPGTLSPKPEKRPYSLVSQNIRLRDATETSLGGFEIVDCGFCDQDTPCTCGGAAVARAAPGSGTSERPTDTGSEGSSSFARKTSGTQIVDNSTSRFTLDRLPPCAPPVPLRRLPTACISTKSATERWIINPDHVPSASSSASNAVSGDGRPSLASDDACTGDPANCPACADDPANQAFCAALGEAYSDGEEEIGSNATATPPPLASRIASRAQRNGGRSVHFLDEQGNVEDSIMSRSVEPYPRLSVPSLCCGDPKLCGGGCDVDSNGDDRTPLVPLPSYSSIGDDIGSIPISRETKDSDAAGGSKAGEQRTEKGKQKEMIPCNAAWAQLSSHPNIAFADLSLLADVVARRDHIKIASSSSSRCSSSSATARSSSGPAIEVSYDHSPPAQHPTSLPPRDERNESTRNLVAHDQLVLSGLGHRRRVRQVPNDGVQDALSLLNGVRNFT